ncbi:MAG: MYXO-CTERM sorting domain-containing protein, partial [Myxococcota bacterium]
VAVFNLHLEGLLTLVDHVEGYIRTWTVRTRISVDEATCDTWTEEESTDVSFNVVNQGEQTLEVEVENGNDYDVCVFGEDEAGNPGEVSPTVVATPRDECDFIECFPGDFEDGYCGAGGASGFAALFAAIGLLLRRRRGAGGRRNL